tara:strand:- start:15 stop:356 length:342 start_codon:yes stop_codon:yes gene_type:complete
MQLLHTEEEVIHFATLMDKAIDITALASKYKDEELLALSIKYQAIVQTELDKYESYIGQECTAPPSYRDKEGKRRHGKIEGDFYFNNHTKSVRCRFNYTEQGFDTHAITQLID